LILLNPAGDSLLAYPGLLGDQAAAEAFLQVQFDGLEFEFEGIAAAVSFGPSRHPPRGVRVRRGLVFYRG
jgi:hypothetical protein